jgi:cytochrome c oxidase subunit I+III
MSMVESMQRPDTAPRLSKEDAARLEQTWRDPPGILGWFSAINHKTISLRFMITTFVFFILGGLLALAIRLQLAGPDGKLIGADLYNQMFTMHGSTMMFLFAVPVMQAVATYLVPLMIGARSVAFPRMNAFAYWIFTLGGIMLFIAFFLNVGPDAGWFAYVPLSSLQYSPTKRVDIWAQMITFTELAGLMEAIVLITTILKMRAPSWRLPSWCCSRCRR